MPLSLDATYVQLADALRTCWHRDLPIAEWLATRWDLQIALFETHRQTFAQIAERLHALGVQRDHHRELSAAWLRRHHIAAAMFRADARLQARLREWGVTDIQAADDREPVQLHLFPAGPLLGGPGHRPGCGGGKRGLATDWQTSVFRLAHRD